MDLDRSLDERIAHHSSRGPPRARRTDNNYRDSYPRDGPGYRDSNKNLDKDWVHDRFEDDHFAPRQNRGRSDPYLQEYDRRLEEPSAKLRVDNLHYDLQERDIRDLFERIGPVKAAEILYDRSDRSRGIAYVTYEDERDARDAIREFDGANAYGQPITLTLMPAGPSSGGRGPAGPNASRAAPGRSLFDRVQAPGNPETSRGSTRGGRRPVPSHIDRYVPGDSRSRSPPRRRGGAAGRRPGAARDAPSRRGGRRNKEDEGRPVVQGRPRKTVDELDAEMDDYFQAQAEEPAAVGNGHAEETKLQSSTAGAQPGAIADDDIEMAI